LAIPQYSVHNPTAQRMIGQTPANPGSANRATRQAGYFTDYSILLQPRIGQIFEGSKEASARTCHANFQSRFAHDLRYPRNRRMSSKDDGFKVVAAK